MFDQVVQTVIDWVYMVGPVGIYLVFTVVAYLENILPPVPGDVLVAFSGYLAAEEIIGVFPIWMLTVIASVVGFMNMYWFGLKLEGQISANRQDHFLLKFINYKYIRTGKIWMNKYGQWVVVANRFLAGTRSVISLTAGMSHLTISYTLVSAFVSSALWNAILIGSGWIVKENWAIIGEYISAYGKIILIGIAILIFSRYFWRKTKVKKASENK